MTTRKPDLPVNRGQLGRLLALSHRTLAELLAAGVIAPTTPGRGRRPAIFDAMVAVPAALEHERRRRNGASARDRRDDSHARLNELKLQREQGAVLDVEAVAQVWEGILLVVRERLLSLPTTLAPTLAAESDPRRVFDVLTAAVRDALQALAEWRPRAPKETP
jgi:hypothetical protein